MHPLTGRRLLANDERFCLNAAPAVGFVAQIGLSSDLPLPLTDLAYSLCFGNAKCCEAVEDGGTDLDFRDLPIEVTRGEAPTKQFDAMHPLPGSRLLANHETGISRCKGPDEPRNGIATDNVLCRRHKVLKFGTVQFSTANSSKLSTNPVVCLMGKPNSTLIVGQACIASLV
jgi:hypothetical protein